MRAGSVRSLSLGGREKYNDGSEDANSAFAVPIPTDGNPTEVLANRFQGMWGFRCRSHILLPYDLTFSPPSLAQDLEGFDCLFQGSPEVL